MDSPMKERVSHREGLSADMEALLETESQAINTLATDVRSLKVNIADPGPTGLLAFGITTTLAMMIAAGAVDSQSKTWLVAHATMHGGVLQVLAGMWEFRRGNVFGATVFSGYGMFWIVDTSSAFLTKQLQWSSSNEGHCLWLCLWALFTLAMGMGTLYTNRVLQFVFCTLFCTFILLAAGVYNESVDHVAGGLGVVCGLSAIYLGWAELMNDVYKMEWIPVWPVHPPACQSQMSSNLDA